MEEYSTLQQKPNIKHEFDKLLTSAIETAQSLISFVPPMVVDCHPNPDIASKAYPSLQGDPTNYVTTQPALFFSYEAGGDKINGECELLPPESRYFSRNWSDKESGVQVFKQEIGTQTVVQQYISPPRYGQYYNRPIIRNDSKCQQMRRKNDQFENKQLSRSFQLGKFLLPPPPYGCSTYNQNPIYTDV